MTDYDDGLVTITPAVSGDLVAERKPPPGSVTCASCQYFEFDTVGDGTGIGQCIIGASDKRQQQFENKVLALGDSPAWWNMPTAQPALWPHVYRLCGEFESV